MSEFPNHEHGFTNPNLIRCPLHGDVHPINEYCLQCWGEHIAQQEMAATVAQRPKVPHYQQGGIEPIDYIRSHNMNHLEGCIIKYVTRWPFKDDPIGDLKKARDYLNWLIEDAESIPTMPIRAPVPPKER